MAVTCPPQSPSDTPCLTSIPPELLLRIICFLPSTTAFLPLSQTSSGLRHFFSLHASKICNDFILLHFPIEASLLRSQVRDGWLLPTSRWTLDEESLFIERRRRFCRVYRGKVQPAVQPGVDVLATSHYEADCSCCPHKSSRSGHHTQLPFALSTPGPLYLGFLEDYSMDIRIRGELAGFLPTEGTTSSLEDESELNDVEFAWPIATYAVRPHLRKLDALILNYLGYPVDFNAPHHAATTPPSKTKSSLGQLLLAKSGLGKIFPFKVRGKTRGNERIFGELPPEPGERKRRGKGSDGGIDPTRAIMLWHVRIGSVEGLAPPPRTSVAIETPLLWQKKEQKTRDLMQDIEKKAKTVEQRLRFGLITSSERVLSLVRRRCSRKQRGFMIL